VIGKNIKGICASFALSVNSSLWLLW